MTETCRSQTRTMTDYIWPEVFTNENFAYVRPTGTRQQADDELRWQGQAIADGLCGWANCMAGAEPPALFGSGMVKVSRITGAMLCEELSAAQKKWLEEWDVARPAP